MNPARAVLEECTEAVRAIVRAERAQSGSVKRAVHLAASRLGLSTRRIEAYWWGEAASVQAHEADAIRRAKAAMHAEEAARLAADLERHRRARSKARKAIRPVLHLKPPAPPRRQGRLAL
ncbi:hypothetical protein GXW74_19900 [Roseomonas eburnea]|uniref:Uncharacterized protein n=1 Tax=Neoroseomonas eburnea TaxID=1346889 RepID=A0A9X9XGD0_9PROT|nr:hypothetical protein [Neoroseomonas eburnea]MBR0682766.1 hypothetical protein [Neoroseomonas eburnea]